MLEDGASYFSDFYTPTNMDEVVTLLEKMEVVFPVFSVLSCF